MIVYIMLWLVAIFNVIALVIEYCFKELKDTFYFDQYQARHSTELKDAGTDVLLHGLLLTG